jgi:hypothetical protein
MQPIRVMVPSNTQSPIVHPGVPNLELPSSFSCWCGAGLSIGWLQFDDLQQWLCPQLGATARQQELCAALMDKVVTVEQSAEPEDHISDSCTGHGSVRGAQSC